MLVRFLCESSVYEGLGGVTRICTAIVLHPEIDRTHFHLIYATRSTNGVQVFIRSSERRFYQKVLDIYATSADLEYAELQALERKAMTMRDSKHGQWDN
jgi:hypothetical protein